MSCWPARKESGGVLASLGTMELHYLRWEIDDEMQDMVSRDGIVLMVCFKGFRHKHLKVNYAFIFRQ